MHFRPKSQLEWINKPPLYLGGQSYRQGTAATSFGLNVNQKPLISQLFLLPGSQFTDVNANMRRSTCASVHVQVHLVQVETHLLSTAARKNIEIFLALFSFDPGQWTAPLSFSEFILYWYYDIIRYQPLQLHDNHVSIGFINIKCYVPSSDFHPPTRFQWCKRIWIATSSLVK